MGDIFPEPIRNLPEVDIPEVYVPEEREVGGVDDEIECPVRHHRNGHPKSTGLRNTENLEAKDTIGQKSPPYRCGEAVRIGHVHEFEVGRAGIVGHDVEPLDPKERKAEKENVHELDRKE